MSLTHPALRAGSPLSRTAGEGAERSEAGEGGDKSLRAGLLSELAIEVEDPLVRHPLEQEIGQSPYQRVNPVGRVSRRAQVDIAVAGGHKAAHLIFELREASEVVNPALLVKRRYRLGPSDLAA